MKKDRGKVWLGVSGVVENENGEWLVVKKTYSGLKGRWSLPAGFVQEGETIDEAAVREVKEETGIDCYVKGLIGFRTGVIRGEISDNMAILYCGQVDASQSIVVQEREILEAHWISPKQLAVDELSNIMLKEIAKNDIKRNAVDIVEDIVPEEIFGYTQYNLFIKK
ncbi:NUDIX domain-containing protein [Lysinibacillus odysseyi]|uniref:NUDIX hydrolase n=1 Tax=Lysinibacillus odysseyi 34hs-1 = NBRC 100172 TaxID=1220589 RepID=A0A0A3ICX5_9BACI|nr:NUDIX hydrolase [Lysinibacillus odysseyi]KGR82594.1 NUDIX hydrolase [Lysinibacillus odysseyi 34hs-1 = NBRC 100172]